MPKIVPLARPAHNVPSRENKLVPRHQAMMSSKGNAPAERLSACNIGGTSGSTSFTATWLNPQLRHSTSIIAMAPALSGRSSEPVADVDDIHPLWAGVDADRCYCFWQCAQVPAISTTDSFGAK